MGAFAALGVGLLGTAAGRAAGTLAMGSTEKAVPLSKLEQLAQDELVQSKTFGSSASGLGDLPQTLLQSLAGPGSGASQQVVDFSRGFDRAGTLSNIDRLQGLRDAFSSASGAKSSGQVASHNANVAQQMELRSQLNSANSAFGTANQRVVTQAERDAMAEEKRQGATLAAERDQIAGRQSAFRESIRGGNQAQITNLSRKTLLGKQL